MYCVYLTIYYGNLLPPFYIGYCKLSRIEKNYHGSVSSKRYKLIWEQEQKNNPHRFKTIVIAKYHTAQEAAEKELKMLKKLQIISNPLYINQAYFPHLVRKGSTWNEMYSPEVISTLRSKRKQSRGKTYEQLYGHEKAEFLKQNRSISNKLRGPRSLETRLKISSVRKERIKHGLISPTRLSGNALEKSKIGAKEGLKKMNSQHICPYCQKVGNLGNMRRWHFENCRITH